MKDLKTVQPRGAFASPINPAFFSRWELAALDHPSAEVFERPIRRGELQRWVNFFKG